MTYEAIRPTPGYAWIITASDGTAVVALPYDMPGLVARAIACAFTSEARRNASG